ncbi:MAG: uracil-DNA glycosylase [Limisphaera sp.]
MGWRMNGSWIALLDALISELERRRSLGVLYVGVSARAAALLEQLESLPTEARVESRARPVTASGPAAVSKEAPNPPSMAAATSSRTQGVTGTQGAEAAGGVVDAAVAPPASKLSPELFPGAASVSGVAAGLSREARIAALAELRQRVLQCVKCPHLAATRKNVVFGVGSPEAELVFVGEAPGVDEDEQGEPFVGAAGQLLTKIIQAMGFTREQVYIANILKCRPDTPGQTSGNRKPTPTEMATCFPWLREQLLLIRPKVIVALGATAVEGLLGKSTVGITRLRGQWQQWEGIPVMPTYHPAYLLRNQSLVEKRKVWEDMLQVLERLGRPITERQRNYFTRAGTERT